MNRGSAGFRWVTLTLSVGLIFALFHWVAAALGSDRGQAGLVVGAIVVLACWLVQRVGWHRSGAAAAVALGLVRPATEGMLRSAFISLLLILVVPAFLAFTDATARFRSGWLWLLPGLLAQAGIAEEVLFRGYLFGTIRERNSFWRAATLSAGPFVAAHLLLFATMAWPLALASTLLALVASFPLARLYDLGGRSIWPPALLHFVMQGTLKVIDVAGDPGAHLVMTWFAASALLPWLAFGGSSNPRRSRVAL